MLHTPAYNLERVRNILQLIMANLQLSKGEANEGVTKIEMLFTLTYCTGIHHRTPWVGYSHVHLQSKMGI